MSDTFCFLCDNYFSAPCLPGWQARDKYCYYVEKSEAYYGTASLACSTKAPGSTLTTILDVDEQRFHTSKYCCHSGSLQRHS